MRYAFRFKTLHIPLLTLCMLASTAQAQQFIPASAAGEFEIAADPRTTINRDAEPRQHADIDRAPAESFAQVYEQSYRAVRMNDLAAPLIDGAQRKSKSGFLAVMYSLVLPGMGELYAGRFDRGKYPLITEAGLWLGLIGVNSYGNWVEDDARTFAIQHAGIDPAGKDDKFFVNIENYVNLADYNNQRLIERRLDEIYPDEEAWRWSWDSKTNRLDYKDQRIFADELHNAVTFFVLGMVANRIWSAIQAGVAVNRHNNSLAERLFSMPSMHARLTAFNGRTDGMQFVFQW